MLHIPKLFSYILFFIYLDFNFFNLVLKKLKVNPQINAKGYISSIYSSLELILVSSFASSISESVISRGNGLTWTLYVTIFSNENPSWGKGAFVKRGHLKEKDVHKLVHNPF